MSLKKLKQDNFYDFSNGLGVINHGEFKNHGFEIIKSTL